MSQTWAAGRAQRAASGVVVKAQAAEAHADELIPRVGTVARVLGNKDPGAFAAEVDAVLIGRKEAFGAVKRGATV